jgi:hypothetical protein
MRKRQRRYIGHVRFSLVAGTKIWRLGIVRESRNPESHIDITRHRDDSLPKA